MKFFGNLEHTFSLLETCCTEMVQKYLLKYWRMIKGVLISCENVVEERLTMILSKS